jgi:hypothetical protein
MHCIIGGTSVRCVVEGWQAWLMSTGIVAIVLWFLFLRKLMTARRFPPPWTVEELDVCFTKRFLPKMVSFDEEF